MTEKTPLNPAHQVLQARLVGFCGWEMPLHYGSQLREHQAVRSGCGVFDISHMLAVDLAGTDAHSYLRRLLANDISKLQPGKALYSCMLSEAGGVLDDLIVYERGSDAYRLVVNACTASQDIDWMAARAAGWQANVATTPRRDLAMLAIQGPKARELTWQALPGIRAATADLAPFSAVTAGELFIARTGYTGEDGFEISLPAGQAMSLWDALLAAGAQPCGLGARDTLRLEAGMCLYGQDMDENMSPLDAGLGWTVDLAADRDFVGKEAVTNHPQRWQFLGLVLSGGGILRARQSVMTAHGEGMVTSGSFSPTLGCSIALARLPIGISVGDTVEVQIRDKQHSARVTLPRFVRHGKILV